MNESNHHSDVIPIIPRNDEKWHFQSFLSHSNVIPIIPGNDENWHFKSFLSHSDVIPIIHGNGEKMAFQVIPKSFLDRMIKEWVHHLWKCLFFWPSTTHFYDKILPKIQHSMCVSTFHRPMNAPDGPFSQPESTTGARRDCDARNCCDARTVSDARSSSGARGKGADSPHVPTPASHSLAPWSP